MPNTLITLESLLPGFDPAECKLHCAVWNGEQHPEDVLASDWEEWVGWNSWRSAQDIFNRRFIFSLAQTREHPTHWLFGGVFEVVGRRPEPHARSYDVQLREDVLPGFVRRLKVGYKPAGRNMRLRLESALDHIQVLEVLPTAYTGQPFPGHDQIDHTLRELEVIFTQQRPDWRGALEHMKGVYVIHDRTSGKPYVGSAIGDTGIWARWNEYVASLHAGNIDLRALVDREGSEYVRDNLTFALLEFWSMRTADGHVLERENYWKRVLMSREHGHNGN